MKTLKIALISTAFAFAPAAYAQVVDQPVEAEEQSAEATEEAEAGDTEQTAPEANTDDTYSEPMSL
jgi:hypothetical protein